MKGVDVVVIAKSAATQLHSLVVREESAHPFPATQGRGHHVHLEDVGPSVVVEIRGTDAHARKARVPEPLRGPVGERAIPVVDIEDIVRGDVVRDIDVGPAIPIDVRYDDAEPIADVPQDPRFLRDIRERPVAIIAIELVVAARGLSARARRMHRDLASREILGRVVEQKQVQVTVPVVIEEDRVGRKSRVRDAVSRRLLGEGAIAVIDEQQVGPLRRLGPFGSGHGDVDVHVSVVVDVDHGRPGGPAMRGDARVRRDILEPHAALVQIEAARDHVAGQKDVR